MSGGIYLIRGENDLVEMTEEAFKNEDLFQVLLAKYPRVLGGDQFDSAAPRKWLLVTREAPIPSEEEGPDRWSVDHIFLDEDAVPTFVEVKRSSDTRIRREVVGQMLDYVSHAVVTWRNERLREYFAAQCGDIDPAEVFAGTLGKDRQEDEFWQRADTNLRAGKVRLVFVADVIPAELERVIQFLNEQMSPAEVLGVEIRQYVGGGLQTLVPRVIGQTLEAQAKKGGGSGPAWNRERFFAAMGEAGTPLAEMELVKDLMSWAEKLPGAVLTWGRGKTWGSFNVKIAIGSERFYFLSLYSDSSYGFNIGWNRENFLAMGQDLSEKYRAACATRLHLDVDRKKWETGWVMAPISSIPPEQRSNLKSVAEEFISDLQSLFAATPGSEPMP